MRAVCAAVTRPVNVLASMKGKGFPVAELEAAGVRRISVGAALYQAAMRGLREMAREVKEQGTFGYLDRSG